MKTVNTANENLSTMSGRMSVVVEAGDSLASIAFEYFGDARFSRLILTINRGELATRCDGYNSYAYIFPGQKILLPNAREAEVYRRNFLTESSRSKFDLAHYARPAMPSDSIPVELAVDKRAFEYKSMSGNWGLATRRESGKHAIDTFAGYVVPQTPIRNTAYGELLGKLQEVCQQETVEKEENKQSVTPFFDAGEIAVVTLSHYSRVLECRIGESGDALFKLQISDNHKWLTIASYEIRNNTVIRTTYSADGGECRIRVDVHGRNSREFAAQDLRDNWRNYTRLHLNQKESMRAEQSAFGTSRPVSVHTAM